MDPLLLVEGGVEGLVRVAQAFRSQRIRVSGIYLIKLTSPDDEERWIIRLVSDEQNPHLQRKIVDALIDLRREQALPRIDKYILVQIVHADDPEPSRIIDYTQQLGGPPVIIRDVMWQGLFIEYAVVAMIPERNAAAA